MLTGFDVVYDLESMEKQELYQFSKNDIYVNNPILSYLYTDSKDVCIVQDIIVWPRLLILAEGSTAHFFVEPHEQLVSTRRKFYEKIYEDFKDLQFDCLVNTSGRFPLMNLSEYRYPGTDYILRGMISALREDGILSLYIINFNNPSELRNHVAACRIKIGDLESKSVYYIYLNVNLVYEYLLANEFKIQRHLYKFERGNVETHHFWSIWKK